MSEKTLREVKDLATRVRLGTADVLESHQLAEEAVRARASEDEKEKRLQEQAREIERLNKVVRGLNTETGRLLTSVESLRAELERLKPSGRVAADVKMLMLALFSCSGVHAQLVADTEAGCYSCGWPHTANAALSRLASQAQSAQAKDATIKALADALVLIKNRAQLMNEEREAMDAELSLVLMGGAGGYAPSPPGITDGSPNHSMPSNGSPDAPHDIYQCHVENCTLCLRSITLSLSKAERYPCSSTCTHEDARTPGHSERVKERSEAFTQALADAGLRIMSDGVARDDYSRGHNEGAEGMRAACWEAVQRVAQTLALGPTEQDMFKAAIEGAAP